MPFIYEFVQSIALIIIGIFITPYFEKMRAQLSQSYNERYIRKKAIFGNTVQFIINNPHEEVILRIRYLQKAIVPLILIIIGTILLISNNDFLSILSFLINIAIIYLTYSLRKLGNLIDEVNKHKIKSNPNIDLDIKLPKVKNSQEISVRNTGKKRKVL